MIVQRKPPQYPRRGPSCLFVLFILFGIGVGAFVIVNADEVRDTIVPTPTPEPTRSATEYALLADLSEKDGEYEEAIEFYETAVRLDATKPQLYIRLINLLVRENQPEKALAYAEQVTLLAPDSDEVWTAVAAAYVANGDRLYNTGDGAGANLQYAEAFLAAQEAININPENATAHAYAAAGLVFQGDFAKYEEAAQYADTAVFLEPNNPIGRLYMGDVFTNLGQYNDAVEQYTLGLDADRTLADLHIGLAYGYFALNQTREAIATFENALEVDPDNAEAFDGLSFMYLQLGEDALAVENAENATQIDPGLARAHGHLGHAHFRQSNYPEAIESLKKATEMYKAPTALNALFFNRLAHAYLRSGTENCDEAIPIFEDVLAISIPGSFEESFAQEGLEECRRAFIQESP